MKITFLGSGTIIPNVKSSNLRSYSSILIEINKIKLLFDIGPGTLSKMHSLGINTQQEPNYVFITHFHIDHCLDYIPLVKSRYFDEKTYDVKRGKKINVFGPPGLKQWNVQLFKNIDKWSYMSKELDYSKVTNLFEVINGKVLTKKGLKISCCPVDHAGGIAFRLDNLGKSFVYTGDMGYDENISILGKNADLVAIECSFPNKKMLGGKHLEPELIGNLAKIGNFKSIILTHLNPQIKKSEKSIIKKIQNIADCKVLFANDFKQISL
jgi:ribonuclease BN (tRNA processing enzyme)